MRVLRILVILVVALTLVACEGSDDARDNPATEIATDGELSVRTPDPDFTPPSLPTTDPQRLVPTTLMFCEPVTHGDDAGLSVLTLPYGYTAIYHSAGCNPDVDEQGQVAVRSTDGTTQRLISGSVLVSELSYGENVIWRPATGQLDGQDVVMTGIHFEPDARIDVDSFGETYVILNLNEDGQMILATLSERIIGRPVATFINSEPLRDSTGDVHAPIVNARLDETIVLAGLTPEDAVLLRDLVNTGNAR